MVVSTDRMTACGCQKIVHISLHRDLIKFLSCQTVTEITRKVLSYRVIAQVGGRMFSDLAAYLVQSSWSVCCF